MATAPTSAKAAPAFDASQGFTLYAKRPMFRAGTKWPAGATEVDAKQAAALAKPIAEGSKVTGLQQLLGDPNFSLAAVGTRLVTLAGVGVGEAPIDAHTVVAAKKTMFRVGRQWLAGVTALDAGQVKELGPQKIARLKADPNFTVTQNDTADADQVKTEAELAKKAAADDAAAIAAAAKASAPASLPAPQS
jgi:hypothetical protein